MPVIYYLHCSTPYYFFLGRWMKEKDLKYRVDRMAIEKLMDIIFVLGLCVARECRTRPAPLVWT